MDRPLIYPMEVPNSSDLLYGWQRTMVALSKLAEAMLGGGAWVTDFSVTPGSGLSVTLGPAQAFVMGPVDATAYSALPADSNQILKQYLLDGYQAINLTAPTTSGDAVNYLLQLTPVDEDTGDVVLQYFDPANPDVAFGGPNNNGIAQATERLNTLQVQLISGAAGPAGSQPTPTLTGIAGVVITVTAGQTSIVASNIVYAAGSAPYVSQKLPYTAVTDLNNFFTASQNIVGDLSVSGTASAAAGVAGNQAVNYTQMTNGSLDPTFGYITNTTQTITNDLDIGGNLAVTGTASAAAGITGDELVNFDQFTHIYSTGNQNQVYANNTTTSTSVSFIAPCNGWCFFVGSRNNSTIDTSSHTVGLSFNNNSIMQDDTELSTTHMGTAQVTSGELCTATYTGAAGGYFSLHIGMIFVPDTASSI